MLVAYSNASTFTATTRDYLESFRCHGSAEVHYLHVTNDARPHLDLERYDAVLLSYCARLCLPGYVSEHFLRLLDHYRGVRAVAIQDEYEFVENERRALDRIRPDVVFTVVPEDQLRRVYPAERYPQTDFVHVLTGYVAGQPRPKRVVPLDERPIVVGYRGRKIGPRYGRLAARKYEIGVVCAEEARRRGVAADISMDEKDRIYGDAWFEWLGRCRCVLGTESGSNIFDWDGDIEYACREAEWSRRPLPRAIAARIAALDDEFSMGQISPRVFEAALMGTAMALYRGRYSDILEPDRHYIPIETDHSNLREVFDRMEEVSALQAMADRARKDLIMSGDYDYAAFVDAVEIALRKRIGERLPRGGDVVTASTITNLAAAPLDEGPTLAPRHFDSFQLRQLMAGRPRPVSEPRQSGAPRVKARRLQRLIDRIRGKRRF